MGFVYENRGHKYGAEALPYLLSVLVKDGRTSMAEGLGAEIGQKMVSQRFATSGSLATLMPYAVSVLTTVRSVDEVVLEGVQSPGRSCSGSSPRASTGSRARSPTFRASRTRWTRTWQWTSRPWS